MIVWPRGKAGELPLWRMPDLNKGHKGKHSSFHTALLFPGEIITIQLPLEKHRGFCEGLLCSAIRMQSRGCPSRTPARTLLPARLVGAHMVPGLQRCHHQSNPTHQGTFPFKVSLSMNFEMTVWLLWITGCLLMNDGTNKFGCIVIK